MKILLIDDNNEITKFLSKILTVDGHYVTNSNDPQTGLSLIKQKEFDLVFLDLSMPKFSGLDIVDKLVQEGMITNKKIIVLTAADISKKEENELKDKGVLAVLRKPITMDSLSESLKLGIT